jgi:hypothetical protein
LNELGFVCGHSGLLVVVAAGSAVERLVVVAEVGVGVVGGVLVVVLRVLRLGVVVERSLRVGIFTVHQLFAERRAK